MFSPGSSNYFFKKDPRRFGAQQENYLERVEEIVQTTVLRFKDACQSEANLSGLFDETLQIMGQARFEIAQAHGTENADLHGRLRRDNSVTSGIMHTSLGGVYQAYNDRLLHLIQGHLREMRHNLKSFDQTEKKIITPVCLGRKTSLDISILSKEKQMHWDFEYSKENYARICHQSSIKPLDSSHSLQECFNHLMTLDVLAAIKKHSIEDYKRLKTTHLIRDIYLRFEGRKSDWVMLTVRCEINGKMYALSQYLTWMYRTFNDDPIDFMTTRIHPTVISIVHQDVFLTNDTLEDIANLFVEVLRWHGENKEELINLIGLINYLFAHAMPFARGSAAISEWIEMALYRFHGLNLEYNQTLSINMEALTLPLHDFIAKYPSMIKLSEMAEVLTQDHRQSGLA